MRPEERTKKKSSSSTAKYIHQANTMTEDPRFFTEKVDLCLLNIQMYVARSMLA